VRPGAALTASVQVSNRGAQTGEEVVQLYLTDEEASAPVPRFALKAFRRIRLVPGEKKRVRFRITPEMMTMVNADGEHVLEPGAFTMTLGGACPDARSRALGAPEPCTARFEVKAG
jgi:beta-glucosidase